MTPDDIRRACEQALCEPKFQSHGGITYCNMAVAYICAAAMPAGRNSPAGVEALFWDADAGRPRLANDMVEQLATHCRQLGFSDALYAAQKGQLVVAGLKMPEHGHVAVVYPFPGGGYTSGKWQRSDVPIVANIGKENGVMPLNWAFAAQPQLYLVELPEDTAKKPEPRE